MKWYPVFNVFLFLLLDAKCDYSRLWGRHLYWPLILRGMGLLFVPHIYTFLSTLKGKALVREPLLGMMRQLGGSLLQL
jgi:hypothetical protein